MQGTALPGGEGVLQQTFASCLPPAGLPGFTLPTPPWVPGRVLTLPGSPALVHPGRRAALRSAKRVSLRSRGTHSPFLINKFNLSLKYQYLSII